jgi:hypothetical protein
VLGRGALTEATVGPHAVVVPPPTLDGAPRVGEIEQELLVQGFVAQLAVKALDVGVVDRLAGADEVQRDTARSRPAQERRLENSEP